MTTWIQDNGGGTIVISNLGDIDDGGGYYKSPVLWEAGDKTKLDGIDTGAKDDQTGDEIVTAINASAGGLDLDKAVAGATNKVLTANEKTGAGNAYTWLTGTGIQEDVPIKSATLNLSQIAVIADDAFQKSADDLDDIDDGTLYQKVNAASVDASGNVVGIYDGSAIRSIGTSANDIPKLGTGGRLPASMAYSQTAAINGSGKFVQVGGTAITADNLNNGALKVTVPINEVKIIPIYSDVISILTAGGVSPFAVPYVETSNTYQQKILIAYIKAAGDQSVHLSCLLQNNTPPETTSVELDIHSVALATGGRGGSVVTASEISSLGVSTNYEYYDIEVDVTGLSDNTMYLIGIKTKVSGASSSKLGTVHIYKEQKVVA